MGVTLGKVQSLIGLLLLAPVALAELSPRDYLSQMSHSFRELDYRGEFTYEYGSNMDTLHIVHAVRDGVEKERLVYLNGDEREVVRDGHHVSCVHPGNQIMRLGSTIASGPFARSFLGEHDIANHYTLAFGETARVAGRPAVQILVRPGDQFRYGLRLFLDEETGILLKSVTLNPSGKILERFQFTRIEVGVPISDAELAANEGSAKQAYHHVLQQAEQDQSADLATVSWLPPGFALSARSVESSGELPVELSMYTDGFSTLTVVLEPAQEGMVSASEGKARRGATVAYTRQVAIDGQPYVLTVVGEVPLVTAQKVARSVAATRGQG